MNNYITNKKYFKEILSKNEIKHLEYMPAIKNVIKIACYEDDKYYGIHLK